MEIIQMLIVGALIFAGICGVGFLVLQPLGQVLTVNFCWPKFRMTDVFCLFVLLQIPCAFLAWVKFDSFHEGELVYIAALLFGILCITTVVWAGVLSALTSARVSDTRARAAALLVVLPVALVVIPVFVIFDVLTLLGVASPRMSTLIIFNLASIVGFLATRRLCAWIAGRASSVQKATENPQPRLHPVLQSPRWSIFCWVVTVAGAVITPSVLDALPGPDWMWSDRLTQVFNIARFAAAIVLAFLPGCLLGIASGKRIERRIRAAVVGSAVSLAGTVLLVLCVFWAVGFEDSRENEELGSAILASAALCGIATGIILGWRRLRHLVWSLLLIASTCGIIVAGVCLAFSI